LQFNCSATGFSRQVSFGLLSRWPSVRVAPGSHKKSPSVMYRSLDERSRIHCTPLACFAPLSTIIQLVRIGEDW